MARVTALQTNFTAGEFSPRLQMRTDISKYTNALASQINFLGSVHGAATYRSGTPFVQKTRRQAKKARLKEFTFSNQLNYVLEYGDLYVRFFRDRGTVDKAHAITAVNTGLKQFTVAGDVTDEIEVADDFDITGSTGNDGEFTVASVTFSGPDTDIVVNETVPDATADGNINIAYAITTPYSETDLVDLKFTQSIDIQFITHPDFEPRQLARTADTDWTITKFDPLDGPYLDQNTTTTTLTPNGLAGTITLTASSIVGINGDEGFKSTDVGRSIRLRDSANNQTWVEITVFNSTTSVDVLIRGPDLPDLNAMTAWRLGSWSDTTGWPFVSTFHQGRLWFGGTNTQPQTIWASAVDDFNNFQPTQIDGTVDDTDAFDRTLDDDQVNTIRWLISLSKGLVIGTDGGEFVGQASGNLLPIKPSDFIILRQSNIGSHPSAMPVKVANSIIYPQNKGREIYDLRFRFEADQFDPLPITTLAEHITKKTTTSEIAEMKYQQEPDRTIWVLLDSGDLIGCTFEASQDVIGFFNVEFGGLRSSVEGISVVDDDPFDLTWLIVKRTVNGVVTRSVEFMEDKFDIETDPRDAFFVDSGLTLDNPVTITGATQADPVVISAAGHTFVNGDEIDHSDIVGMVELNGGRFKIANTVASVSYELTDINTGDNIDGTEFTAYVSDGKARKAVLTISGLDHLEGESVAVQSDGAVEPSKTVSSGSITLDSPGSRVHIGLGYTGTLITLPLDSLRAPIEPRGKLKKVYRIQTRMWRSLGGTASMLTEDGTQVSEEEEINDRDFDDDMDVATPLFTGLAQFETGEGGVRDIQVRFIQDVPAPMTVLGFIVDYDFDGP